MALHCVSNLGHWTALGQQREALHCTGPAARSTALHQIGSRRYCTGSAARGSALHWVSGGGIACGTACMQCICFAAVSLHISLPPLTLPGLFAMGAWLGLPYWPVWQCSNCWTELTDVQLRQREIAAILPQLQCTATEKTAGCINLLAAVISQR